MKKYLKYDREKLAEKKYNHLLIGMIVLMLLGPLYIGTGLNTKFPLVSFIFFSIVQLALKATVDNKRLLLFCRLFVMTALICMLLSMLGPVSAGLSNLLYGIGRSIYVVFLAFTIYVFAGRIIAAERITADKVKGGICLYFLAGVTWAFLYEMIYRFDPNAFNIDNVRPMSFLYYSYSTLTSLGLGDICPTSDFTEGLTCLEAIAGQMFVAVFIARLVGLHILHKTKHAETASSGGGKRETGEGA